MTVSWPLDLPDYVQSWEESSDPTALWTNIKGGKPKCRGEVTVPVRNINVIMQVSKAQFTILLDFFDISLLGGPQDFYFKHPYQDTNQKFFMVAPPQIVSEGPITATVQMKWLQISSLAQSAPLAFTVTAKAGNGQVTLTWTSSRFADSYQVFKNDVAWSDILPNTAYEIVVTGLTNNVAVNLRVVASNTIDDVSSNEVNVIPNPPQLPGDSTFEAVAGHLKATIALTHTVSWSAPGGTPSYLLVKWGTVSGTYTNTKAVETGQTSTLIGGLTTGTYYWRPYSVDDQGNETAIQAQSSFTTGASDVTYYELRVGSVYPGTLVRALNPDQFPYADDNLTAGVSRTYWLDAHNPSGYTSSSSNPQSATPENLIPGDFTFEALSAAGGIRIHLLTTSARATSYQIRQGNTEPGTTIATISEGDFPYLDSPLSPGTVRKYWLAAVNAEGTTYSSSNPISQEPAASTLPSIPQFKVTAKTGAVDIELVVSAQFVDYYVLKRGATEGAATTVDANILENEFPVSESGLTNGVTVLYWLYAVNDSGTVAASNNPLQATPSNSFTNPPGAFSYTLTPGNAQVSIALSPAAAAADYYNIYAGTWGVVAGPDTWRQIGGNHLPGAFPIVDTGRTNGVAQKYWLSAFNQGGVTQATGNPKTSTPTDGKPGSFTFSASIAVASKVILTLDTPASGATSYKIKRDTVQIASGVTTWPYEDTAMSVNVSHSYEVLATNAQGDTAAANNPIAVTPWSAGLSYPANTISWDAANEAKMTLFSGTQALDSWVSKNSEATLDGATSSDSCLLNSGTHSVDFSASPLRKLVGANITRSYPYTISFLAWFPSDCPAVCCPVSLGYGLGFLFRRASNYTVTFTSAISTVLYLNNQFTLAGLDNSWGVVTVIVSSATAVKLRVKGVEVSGTASATMRTPSELQFNATTNGIATVGSNVKIKRIALHNQALSGQNLTDFESIVADGEGSGGGGGGGGGGSTVITKDHQDNLLWVDPRETWASLPTGKYQSQTPGGSYDPSTNSEPGVKAADGVLLMGHTAAPNSSNGFAILHRIRPQNPAADGYWRSGFNSGASELRLMFRQKYIEAFGFYFPASALTSTQQEADIYEHHVAYVAGNPGVQSSFVVYLRLNNSNPRLDIQYRYSLDGTQAGSVGGLIVSIPVQANKWYLFAHKFLHSADLADAPYNYLWYQVDGGSIIEVPKYNGRNAVASPPYGGGGFEHLFTKNELYKYYAWNAGVTEASHYSTGIFSFRDDGHSPTVDQYTLLAMLRGIVKIGETSPTQPTLDPVTDPRTRMLVDANRTFAQHSNIEVITGTSGGYGTNNFAAIPETGLQVDSSSRRLIKRVQGWPGISTDLMYFQNQLDETLPTYSSEKTVRSSVGRNTYDSDITMDGTAWWYAGDMVITDSLYSDVYVAGQNGADSYAPYELGVWGLHHVGDWGANASYYDSTNLPPLTPFSVFFDPRTDRAGGILYIRLRSSTHVSGGTWTVGPICQTKAQVDANGTNRSYTLDGGLVAGDIIKVVLRFRLGYQQSHNPFMSGWVQKNNGAISDDLINDTGPLGHYLADESHQVRALGFLYIWATAYHGNVWPWTRSANGIILSGNHGYRSGTRGSLVMKDVASSGRPAITAGLLFEWLNRP